MVAMTCNQCQEREAVMELTQVANGQVTKVHLCEQCAAERGLENAASLGKSPLASYIAAMGQGLNEPIPAGGTEVPFLCPSCGATLQDFRESGRLGCPDCYRTLGEPLRELLRRLHGATRHTGERYAIPGGAPVSATGQSSLELREQLKRAIESEDFERAAQLRDQLKVNE
jgi:protein arginine kinase activator